MFATKEDDHLISPHHFSSGDYLSVYGDGDKKFVGLINPTPDSANTTEAYITDDYVYYGI